MEETILNINDTETESCSICLKEDLINTDTYITDCSHIFCKTCLDNWFQRGNNACPLCRHEIHFYEEEGLRYHLVIHNISDVTDVTNVTNELNTNNDIVLRSSELYMSPIMKYRISLIFILILFIQYCMNTSYSYEKLLYDYTKCLTNSSNLRSDLNICHDAILDGGDPGTYTSVYDGSQMRQCFYPYKYFYTCSQ